MFVWNGNRWVNNTNRSIQNLDISGVLSEKAEVSNSAASGSINFDAKNYSILYNTVNASANWTLNIRGDNSTTLNDLMDPKQIVTVVHMVPAGVTSYLPTGLNIDGTAVTISWQGESTLSAFTNCLVVYTYNIIKTEANTYSVFGSQVKFTDEMVTTTTTSGGV
jgi:hypothetical protein